jgi:serine/threonine-protein kinase
MKGSPERWQHVARTYEAAIALDPAERETFLTEACAGDDSLRREVDALLYHEAAEFVLDRPVWVTAASIFDKPHGLGPGSTLGPYRIQEAIGGGGMGDVFRGIDIRLNRQIAIKVLRGDIAPDHEARARFAREARAVAALAHPHICMLYDVGRHEETDYLVMEYLDGQTLARTLTLGSLPVDSALTHATEVASALDHAHRHGIIHRDLKPANIMLTAGGAKLLDFGLAKLRAWEGTVSTGHRSTDVHQHQPPFVDRLPPGDGGEQAPTRGGAVMGTVRYMAPEQIDGREVDTRTDIFSFGAVLYEMLTGRRAFDTRAAATGTVPAAGHDPMPVGSFPPQVPKGIEDIVRRCLAEDPEQRWQSAADIVTELRRASDKLGRRSAGPSWIPAEYPGTFAALTLLVGLIGLGLWLGEAPPVSAPANSAPPPIRSLAVLPLTSLSGEDYFADGMTEQLTADLAGIGGLRVIARTSTMHYKESRKVVPDIARELQVDAVIEGSVLQVGDRVQVTARLIRGTTGQILWTQSFERHFRDLLTLQREIAGAVTRKVDITLAPAAQVRLAGARPIDPEVHREVLLARHQAAKATEDGLRNAIQRFAAVISRDPDNGLAYAGLAEAYTSLSGFYVHPAEAMPKARQAAETALRLDDSLAEAHAALGFIHLVYDWDGPTAEKSLLRALDLNSSLAMTRLNYAAYLTSQGRREEAVIEIRKAVNLDPLSIRTYSFGTLFLLFTRRYDEAIELARKGLEFEPESAFTMAFMGVAYAEQRRFDEAVRQLDAAVRLDNSLTIRALQAHVLAVAGRRDEARTVLRQVEDEARSRYFCPYEIATVYVSLGDDDTAVRWLSKGVEGRADCMPWLGVEPWMDPLRADPRYARLLEEIGLTPVGLSSR